MRDFLFMFSEDDKPCDSIPPSLLHAQGSFDAHCWMEDMVRLGSTSLPCHFTYPFFDDDNSSVSTRSSSSSSSSQSTIAADPLDLDELISFKSVPSFSIKTPAHELSDEIVALLLELPLEPASLTQTVAPHHIVDDSHILCVANAHQKPLDVPRNHDSLDFEKVFGVLLDSGCSVSCSGFKEDFHGQLAIGDFGHVNTADGKAKIEGFGMLRWDVLTVDGERRTVEVPGYCSPAVEMRLLSPQDYCRYHKLDDAYAHWHGSSSWMTLELKVCDNNDNDSLELVCAHIDPASRLLYLHAELGHHDLVDGKETHCHCSAHVASSVFDPRNINLTDAQKKLKLDHDRLGHLSMKLIQKLYQPEDIDQPDFDGHSTSGLPCLCTKDSAQLRLGSCSTSSHWHVNENSKSRHCGYHSCRQSQAWRLCLG